jgi:hypothetical protein
MNNPDPAADTTTKGMNEPPAGIPYDEWFLSQLENITPVSQVHVSKHRAGRQPKMSSSAKRRRIRQQRQNISDYLDARAIERALNG